ncbi:MAG: hypothetical protein ACE5GI_08605 [Candidatus Aminicenantales bacterium]
MEKFKVRFKPDGNRFYTSEEMAERARTGLKDLFGGGDVYPVDGDKGIYEVDLTGLSEENIGYARKLLKNSIIEDEPEPTTS